MASSSSTSTMEHYVFLSFRGEDTRVAFTSHLHAALERKAIPTYIDDYLNRGNTISDSLVKAIENSMLSVIIFSKHYASSKWCLEELVKILECRENGQIVIPIFYQVDPSDVRDQTGSFGDAFARLVKRKALEMKEQRFFRDALTEAGNIAGHDSRNIGHESTFIDEIVTDISNKLDKMFPIRPMNLVGIGERISKIEPLLEMESQKVRSVGVWGMGGIGKTTIAKAIYNKIRTEFEASLFVPSIRETPKVVDLQTSIVLELLGNKISNTGSLSFENHRIKHELRRKKVLLVFDDVDDPMHLEELLLGQQDSFGPGSRILVTSRDRHVLNQVVDAIYGVEALNNSEALQLFKSKAFKKIDPTSDHEDVLDMMVYYAKGNPLALLVLGSALCDRNKEDWYSKLKGLEQNPEVKILEVLKISYDGLSKEEKNVFLDIACYFRGMDRYSVTPILEKKSPSVGYCISVLIDKSLITETFGNQLQMHDLLRDMAYSIVNEESKSPRKRSRLVYPKDIYHVLKRRKGTKAVRGICLDLAMPESRKMRLKSDDFEGMRGLEFLIIKGNTSKVQLPHRGLEYLPKKLRYFQWYGYPSRSLPQKFCAKNLVDFDFQHSKVGKLWSGRQELVNLRRINLSQSYRLTELPDLSEAKKLQHVHLSLCKSLIEVPSYFQYFEKMEELSLCYCHNLQSFPRKLNSNNIKSLSLMYCSNIKKSPEIPGNIEDLSLASTAIEEVQQSFGGEGTVLLLWGCLNITKFPKISGNIRILNLVGTAIDEVPPSIQFLTSLRQLDMDGCKKLSRLSDSICKLKSLKFLSLSRCLNLENFPEINEPMESLEQLDLSETAITELPSSIRLLTNLESIGLSNCKKLSSLPNSICELKSLGNLDILGCSKLESLPKNMECMESLVALRMGETAVRELPELPPSLESLLANNCESLEIISSITVGHQVRYLYFTDCLKLDEKALMEVMQLKIQFGKIQHDFEMVLPGSEIPQWFSDQSRGSSTTIQFPSNHPKLKAIVFCLLVVHQPYDLYNSYVRYHLKLLWEAKINNDEDDDVIRNDHWFMIGNLKISESDHMYLWYGYGIHDGFSKKLGHQVRFEFNADVGFGIQRYFQVKMCGVHLIHENPDGLSISDDEKLKMCGIW